MLSGKYSETLPGRVALPASGKSWYDKDFRTGLAAPHVMLGVNVFAADTDAQADPQQPRGVDERQHALDQTIDARTDSIRALCCGVRKIGFAMRSSRANCCSVFTRQHRFRDSFQQRHVAIDSHLQK
mgnify:CR=1 FL=1